MSPRTDASVERALAEPERAPLAALLDDACDEPRLLRMWHGVEGRQRRAPVARVFWPLAASLALALVCVGWLWLDRPAAGGPLLLQSGGSPSVLTASADGAALALADGSRVILNSGSRIEVLRNDARSFVTVLRRGEGTFDVRPGGPRRWVIEAGLASVEVLGTRFRVVRGAHVVRVEVERGVVSVRGEGVPGGIVRLAAGASTEVRDGEAETAAAAAAASSAPVAAALAVVAPPPSAVAALAPAPSRASVPSGPDLVDAHLVAADRARRDGRRQEAIRELEQVLEQASPRDPRRGLAALSLARLTSEEDPARAALALEASMNSMPRDLAEDALAREVDALGRAGRREDAARLAAQYLQRFPAGQRVKDVRRWLSP